MHHKVEREVKRERKGFNQVLRFVREGEKKRRFTILKLQVAVGKCKYL